jgi:hypothetical protein
VPPLTVDGLVYAESMANARWGAPEDIGSGAGMAAPVSWRRSWPTWHTGMGHGLIGPAVATRPAVALAGSYELLMKLIHGSPAGSGWRIRQCEHSGSAQWGGS